MQELFRIFLEVLEANSARVAQDHPRRDDTIGEMGEGNTGEAVVALGDVAVVHAPIIPHHTPHASTNSFLFALLTPYAIDS